MLFYAEMCSSLLLYNSPLFEYTTIYFLFTPRNVGISVVSICGYENNVALNICVLVCQLMNACRHISCV